jgi:hypothetical protein
VFLVFQDTAGANVSNRFQLSVNKEGLIPANKWYLFSSEASSWFNIGTISESLVSGKVISTSFNVFSVHDVRCGSVRHLNKCYRKTIR